MVDFFHIHKNAMDKHGLCIGEYLSVAPREPLSFDRRPDATITLVKFVKTENGWEPASEGDRRTIADWENRHRNSRPEAFDLPFPWISGSDKPWAQGGKEDFLDRGGIAMTHDELVEALGGAHDRIIQAGFVLVPRSWRDNALAALNRHSDSRKVER